MSDYIKREDALNAFRRVYMIPGRGTAKEIYAKQIENTYKQIESVPSADVVERKHGKWIEHEDGWGNTYYDCSACGESWATIEGTPMQNGMNYCPNCGASMRQQEGTE